MWNKLKLKHTSSLIGDKIQESKEKVHYFAYGSNLDPNQMEKRGVFIYESMVGKLSGYELIFPIFSQARSCGVADIIPGEGFVYGVVYTLDMRGMERLDMYEGFYNRERVKIQTKIGTVEAFTYVVDMPVEEKKETFITPSKRYIETIIRGAEQHEIDQDYVNRLESIYRDIS